MTGVLATSLTHVGDLAGVLGHLSDGGAHAALRHAVRTAEVELEPVGARALGGLDDLVPLLALRLHHQRHDDGVLRVALLDLGDLAQVHRERTIGDELDVVEPHHALPVQIHRRVARRDVDDRVAERLPHRAAPAGVERAHDLVAGVRRRRRRQPERIRRLDARQIHLQISHEPPPAVPPSDRSMNCAIPTAARLPSATALTTSWPPDTQSPPAK